MRLEFLFSSLLFCCVYPVMGQEKITGEAAMEAEITALSDDYEAENIIESLSLLAENPVMINSGDEEEIGRLFFLTEFQVKVLADHVEHHQIINTIYEIATLPGFDRSMAILIEPYVSFEAPTEKGLPGGGIDKISGTTMIRMRSDGSRETGVRTLFRFSHEAEVISYGMTAENDPGEPFTFKNACGPDFLSGYIMYHGSGFLERVIVGDYSLRFGEGITFNTNNWQGSRVVNPSFMTGRSIARPYMSTEENNYLRGVACVLGKITDGAVLFFSCNAIDARLGYNQEENSYHITNLVRGGLHDTESGLSARNTLTEKIAGVHLSAGTESVRGGVTALLTLFSLPFFDDAGNRETAMRFSGDRLLNIGADLKAGTGKILFFSEASYSMPGSIACIAGLRAIPSGRITFNLLARHYSTDYFSFHSKAFSSGTWASNESGVTGSIHLEAARHLFISAGTDLCHYPWARYRSSGPSTGSRTELKCEYSPDDNFRLRLSLTVADKEYDITEGTGVPSTTRQTRTLIASQVYYSPSEMIRLTSRGIYCHLNEKSERGYMLSQDILLSLSHLPVRLWARFSLFSTESYDTRLYALENDMLQTFNMPPLYGEGSRCYLMLSWKPFRRTEVRAKFAVTTMKNAGVKAINREVRLQGKVVF